MHLFIMLGRVLGVRRGYVQGDRATSALKRATTKQHKHCLSFGQANAA